MKVVGSSHTDIRLLVMNFFQIHIVYLPAITVCRVQSKLVYILKYTVTRCYHNKLCLETLTGTFVNRAYAATHKHMYVHAHMHLYSSVHTKNVCPLCTK